VNRFLTIMASRWMRLVLVLLIVLSLQTTLFTELRPFGVAIGALTGLIAGLMYDLILSTPVGLGSVALGLAGATAGLLIYFFNEPTWWMRSIAIAVVSSLGEIYYPLVQATVGLDGWLQLRLVKVVLVVAVCNLLLSPLAIVVCRWTLSERKTTL